MPDIPELIGNEFFSMDVHGFNRVANNLRTLAAEMPELSAAVAYDWAQETRLILKTTKYPAKRYKQKYKRTGRLANSWRAARLPNGATILNTAHRRGRFYSRYVVGNAKGAGQAWMHKGRWWKAREIVDENIPSFTKKLTAALVAELEKG